MLRFNLLLIVFGLVLASTADASLRVRYCNCKEHGGNGTCTRNSEENENNDVYSYNFDYIDTAVTPGAWDGYSAETGFDNAGVTGTIPENGCVDDTFWVDSLLEIETGGAFTGNGNELLRTSGYFVMIYGGLEIPEPGEYTLFNAGDDQNLWYWLDVNQDGILAHDSTEFFGGCHDSATTFHDSITVDGDTLVDAITKYRPRDSNYTVLTDTLVPETPHPDLFMEGCTQTFNLQQGRYRIKAWKWNYGGTSHAGLFWKKPGADQFERMPSSAFGERKQFGPPEVTLDSVAKNGVIVENTGFIQATPCDTLTYYATPSNMLGKDPVYIWQPNDTTMVESTENHFDYSYLEGNFTPAVNVIRGDRKGFGSTSSMFVAVNYKDETCPDPTSIDQLVFNHTEIIQRGKNLLIPSKGETVSLRLYGANGREVKRLFGVSQGSHSLIQLDNLNLKGYYIAEIYKNDHRAYSVPLRMQ